jgi:nucleotide-binding universal stress UspA family protein
MIERLDKERSKPRPSKRRRPSSKKTFPKSVKKKKPPDPKVLWFAGELIAEEKAKRKAAKAKRKAAILKAEKLARRQIRDGIVSKDAVLRAMRENKEVGAEDIAEGQRRALTRKAPLDPRASGFPDLSRKRKRTNI